MEFRWPAGWPELPFTSQLQQGSLEVTSCLPGRPKLRAVVRIFVPPTTPPKKSNTEYTSATVHAARIASTVISYTLLALVHVQESYLQ